MVAQQNETLTATSPQFDPLLGLLSVFKYLKVCIRFLLVFWFPLTVLKHTGRCMKSECMCVVHND